MQTSLILGTVLVPHIHRCLDSGVATVLQAPSFIAKGDGDEDVIKGNNRDAAMYGLSQSVYKVVRHFSFGAPSPLILPR